LNLLPHLIKHWGGCLSGTNVVWHDSGATARGWVPLTQLAQGA
jgi:hypothetical protein